jgi:hypothetical protein
MIGNERQIENFVEEKKENGFTIGFQNWVL